MNKKSKSKISPAEKGKLAAKSGPGAAGYDDALRDIVLLLEQARRAAARSVNAVMAATYWAVGRRIVEEEQGGRGRAAYGEQLLERLSADLTKRFGRGFGLINLQQMRRFYLERKGIKIH